MELILTGLTFAITTDAKVSQKIYATFRDFPRVLHMNDDHQCKIHPRE